MKIMKKNLPLSAWRRGIATIIVLGCIATARAGLLQTQCNPVNFGSYYWADPNAWDALGIPRFQADTPNDGTHSRDVDFISIAHDNNYFYVRIHATQSPVFGGDWNLWMDTDVNPSTGDHNWSGNGSIGSEYLITGAALIKDPYTWIFVDWLNWDQTSWDTNYVARDVFFSINRQTQMPNLTAFNFTFQFYNSSDGATGDWYPDSADSRTGDYFQYTTVLPKPGTVLTFDGVASGTVITNGFGGYATASSTGLTVTSNGTPAINLLWAATGGAGTDWEFYNDSVWSAAQLHSCDVGDYYDLHFAPTNGDSVTINSFDFDGYYSDNERFTFGMEIWDNGTLLTNWTYTFLSDGTANHHVNVNFTGQPGHELVLSFNRNASTLGSGEIEGDPADIAVDNISFSQTAPPVSVHAAIVKADGPVAFWRLDEAAGPTAFDIVGGNNATYTGTVTFGVTGAISNDLDKAAEFDGSTGYATAPYAAALNPSGAFSVEAWVRPLAVPNSAGTPAPIASATFTSPRSGWQIRERDTGWEFVTYNQNGTTAAVNIRGGGTPVVGTWYHLVGVWDGTQGYLYVNGSLAITSAPTTFVANAGGPFTIGCRSSISDFFFGDVDEAVFYNRVLSASEIQSHFANRPRLDAGQSGANLLLTYPVGTLLESTNVVGPYAPTPSATSPFTAPETAPQKFYRVQM